MHPHLQEQIRQYITDPDALPEEWQNLLAAVSATYYESGEEQQQWSRSVTQLAQEMRTAHQERQQSTSHLQAILDAFPDLFFRLDAQGTYLDYRSGAATKLYIPPEQFLNKTIHDTFPPAQAAAFLQVIQQSLKTQTIVSYEYSLLMDGEAQYFELRAIPISQEEVVAVVREITARQLAEMELRNQKALFENLVKVARMTATHPDLEATLQNVVDVTTALTGSEWGNLFLLNPNGEISYAIMARGGVFAGDPIVAAQTLLEAGIEGMVVRQREAVLVHDTQQDERWLNLPETRDEFRSALAIPILNGSLVSGVLTLLHTEPGYFSEEQRRLMDAAAEQIALALRNAQIFETQRQMTTRQFILYELLRIAGQQHTPTQVMNLAVNVIARLTDWLNISISTPAKGGQNWMIRAASGQLIPRIGAVYSITRGIIGRAIRSQQIQNVPDVRVDPDYVVGQSTTRSELAVPIMREDRLLGVLDLQSEHLHNFTPDDLLLAESVAGTVALALDNARLYSDVESHLSESRTLYSITQLATQTLVLEDVLTTALDAMLRSLGYTSGLILLKDPADELLRIGASYELSAAFQNSLLQSEVARLCYEQHQARAWSVIWPETPLETIPVPEAWAYTMRTQGITSFACAPLLHQDKTLGAFYLFDERADQPRHVTPRLITAIGHQIGVAVANAYLHEDVAAKQSQLRTLIEASRNGVILVSPDGTMRFVNAAAFEMFAFPSQPADWVNRPISYNLMRLRHQFPKIVKSLITEIRRVLQGSESSNEGEWEAANRVIQWANVPVVDAGQFQGWLLITRDVTEERRVARMREDLTQTMVHDLRNPLTAIAGAIEMIQFEMENKAVGILPQMVGVISMNAGKMLNLVNTIMDISRLESRQMPLRWAAFRLRDLINEAFQLQAPLVEEKNLQLIQGDFAMLPLVWADADLVARVLQNLIGNAIKFSPEGGTVQVAAAVETQPDGKEMIRITIQDDGPGIAEDMRERLFQKFASGRHKESGSGVGLAFCQLAVQAHGGRIWADFESVKGAIFHFTLPVVQLENHT